MEIAALRVKIMFQRQEAVADGIGNHTDRKSVRVGKEC